MDEKPIWTKGSREKLKFLADISTKGGGRMAAARVQNPCPLRKSLFGGGTNRTEFYEKTNYICIHEEEEKNLLFCS